MSICRGFETHSAKPMSVLERLCSHEKAQSFAAARVLGRKRWGKCPRMPVIIRAPNVSFKR